MPRLQKRIGLLIPKEPGLNLHVGAVVIGKRVAPIESIGIDAPGPDLFRRNLAIVGEMHGSGVGLWIPDPHKIFTAPVGKLGDWPIRLVAYNAQIFSPRIHRPGFDFGKSVSGRKAHGIFDPRVVPGLYGRIVPPIEAMAYIASVIQCDPLFQNG